jgi:hypothetical protein
VPSVPKQHHYIPQTYLSAFASVEGYVCLYDLWNEARLIRTTPKNMLKEKDLYTQPVHAEGRFDTNFETLFSEIEGWWPTLLNALESRQELDDAARERLFEFIVMMRVRVKTTLKAASKLLQEIGEDAISAVDQPLVGEALEVFRRAAPDLGPSQGRSDVQPIDLINAGLANLSVDPHRALVCLPNLVLGMAHVVGRMGLLSLIHNRTAVDFITSDNPVVYQAKNSSGNIGQPYTTTSSGDFEFYFPLSPRLAIRFATYARTLPTHRNEFSENVVRRMNLLVARFADRYVVTRNPVDAAPLLEFADECPIPDRATSQASLSGEIEHIGYKWGPPIRSMPKWDYDIPR